MVFNVLTGNTDDHLRNHGFLRVRDGWRLSPAYDLNPNPKAFAARAHILPILPGNHHPALERCVDAAPYFKMTTALVKEGLLAILDSLERWRDVARQNGLTPNEITRMAGAFEHEGKRALVAAVR
jgi:serine/threonine-protein kinase HipA